jgi:hypothetical protein
MKSVEIFNVMGKHVYQQKITSNKITINTENFPSGIYAVRLVHVNKSVFTEKLIIE